MLRFTTSFDDFPTIYYPIGNDKSADITQGLRIEDKSCLLFLGCGDIRNVIHTVHGLCQRDLNSDHEVQIYLNDIEDGVLARDVLLLHLVRTLDPHKEDDMLFLWAVWYDVILSQDQHRRLKKSLRELSSECEDDKTTFGNEETRARIKSALTSWSNSDLSAQEIREKRREFFKSYYVLDYPEQPTDRVAGKIAHQHCMFTNYPILKERYLDEVRDYLTFGQTRVSRSSVQIGCLGANVTFMRPGSDTWAVEDNSSPYMCYDPGLDVEKYDGKSVSMSSLFLMTLKQWVISFQAAAEHRLFVQISFWLGEATAVVEHTLPADVRFDFIDTSNIADRVGLLTLLIYCSGILRKESGVLFTETYKWHNVADDVGRFLRQCIDISPLMYPTVLGLHLAEELELGHEKGVNQGSFVGYRKLSLRWRAARVQKNLVRSADEKADAVSSALELLESMKQRKHDSSTTIDTLKCKQEALSKLQTRLQDSLTSTGGQEQRKYAVKEMMILYKVTFNAGPEQLTGSWAVQEDAKSLGTVAVVNSYPGSSKVKFKEIIDFSCDVTIKKSKIVPSPETGTVIGTFYKDRASSVGERVLPWKLISKEDIMHLRNYPQTALAMHDLKTEVVSMFPSQGIQLPQSDPPVEVDLMKVILYFLKTAPESFGVNVLISLATPSLQRDRSRYFLEGWKVFEDKPATFVTWYDLELGERLAIEGKVNWLDVAAVADASVHHIADTDSNSRGEAVKQLKRILLLNSYRLTQDLPQETRWKTRSFVRARFPFMDFDTLQTEIQLRNRFFGGGVGAMSGMFEKLRERLEPTGVPESSRQPTMNAGNRCAVCNKSDDVRRCSRCLRVAYCSKQCQRQDWKSHKKQCQKQ